MEGKITVSARRQMTNKLGAAYRRASKTDKGRILTEVVNATGMGRSTARRWLTGPVEPATRRERPVVRKHSPNAWRLLHQVWALMGLPCGKCMFGGVTS